MPHFSYKAIGRDGKSRDGTVEADGLELASRQLRAQGFTLLKLQAGASAAEVTGNKASGKPPGRQEILSMTSELAVLLRAGLPLAESYTPIQPVMMGGNARALAASVALQERGLLVGALRRPTVPEGQARLRVTLSALHSEREVDALVSALAVICKDAARAHA